jgi:hypothetical protein
MVCVFSPDSNEKPFEKNGLFLWKQKSDQRKLFLLFTKIVIFEKA